MMLHLLLLLTWLCLSINAAPIHGPHVAWVRGGGDEERYSRQVYTLGQRAHGLIRSATVYLDGPLSSGLLYECAKNLALSGVGTLVILTNDEDDDDNDRRCDGAYHHAAFDDLGRSYQLATRTELGVGDDVDDGSLLQMYLQKINPSIQVSISQRPVEPARDSVFVAVDRPHKTQIRLNNWCRENAVKFVSIETAGVFGKTFCDFGPSFTVYDPDGETPLEVPVNKVEVVDDNKLWIHCVESEKHDVSRGDIIEFHLATGETIPNCQLEVLQVKSPTKFLAGCAFNATAQDVSDSVNQTPATFRRLKIPTTASFSSLDSLSLQAYSPESSLFAICDLDKSFDANRRAAILASFQKLGDFIESNGGHPTDETASAFQSMASTMDQSKSDHELWARIVQSFAKTCKGKLTPVQGILAAIGAQEALKAATGLYSPIQQFLLYDCDELLEVDRNGCDDAPEECAGQSYVLGSGLSQSLSTQKLFVVGAGAIGCELLKNLAAMGARRIVLTDMDTIEHSNLSRQLLFRDSDIGSFKSVAALKGVSRHNPCIKIEVHTSKVGDDENGPFDDEFWDNIDVVLNALDNVDARLYVDKQCVAYQKALVDAGTLGSKGNVQVVVPFQSESYGSSVDPQEQAIPVCTLKNFPYLISHTIQWGRDLFEGFFDRRAKQVNDMVELLRENDDDFVIRKLLHDLGDEASLEAATEVLEDLTVGQFGNASRARDEAISWAARCADRLFRENIEAILRQHPLGSLDDDEEPFWTGARRAPMPLRYDADQVTDVQQEKVNENLLAFVQNCARLRLETLHESFRGSEKSIVPMDEAKKFLQKETSSDTSKAATLESIISRCRSLVGGHAKGWSRIEFEKDDDSNGHVDFVAAASNLRAICYGIAPVDVMETRRVAGNIVPAMITTTSLVSALSCVELLKLVQKVPLKTHRNAFVNLALPFFAFTQPVPAETTFGVRDRKFTLWDRILVKEGKKTSAAGGIKMKQLLSRIIKKVGLAPDAFQVSSISYGPYMIYANYLNGGDRELLKRPVWDAVGEALKAGNEDEFASRDGIVVSPHGQVEALLRRRFLDLSVVVEDIKTGDEVEIPPVRIVRNVASTRSRT
ncbi:ThiF family [Fragilaria crotonensis]|nr:ThiF family [Fragilaria crotonensis]